MDNLIYKGKKNNMKFRFWASGNHDLALHIISAFQPLKREQRTHHLFLNEKLKFWQNPLNCWVVARVKPHSCTHLSLPKVSGCRQRLSLIWFNKALPSLVYQEGFQMPYLNTQGTDALEISALSQTRLTLSEPNRPRTDRDRGEGEQSDKKSDRFLILWRNQTKNH